MARTWKLRIRLNESEYALLLEYQRDHGHDTKSAAAREMMRRQGRYSRWKRERRGRQALQEPVLRRIARDILRRHPDATESQLGYNLMKHAGQYVDAELIKKIVAELTGFR